MRTVSPFGPEGRAGGEPAEADLGALQVGEDADGAAGHVGGGAYPLVIGLVICVVAMAEVEPGDVHSGLDQRPDGLVSAVAGPRVQTIFPRLFTTAQHSRESVQTTASGKAPGYTGSGRSDSPIR